jgi:hypothetical protein
MKKNSPACTSRITLEMLVADLKRRIVGDNRRATRDIWEIARIPRHDVTDFCV